jgi:uncharacterized protein (DUF1330 family)
VISDLVGKMLQRFGGAKFKKKGTRKEDEGQENLMIIVFLKFETELEGELWRLYHVVSYYILLHLLVVGYYIICRSKCS